MPEPPQVTEEERLAEAVAHAQLFRAALKIARELDMPISLDYGTAQAIVETSATKVEAEPAKETTVAPDDIHSPTEQVSPVTTPAETTEPEPGRPKFEDAF